jgi:hypothetical protein
VRDDAKAPPLTVQTPGAIEDPRRLVVSREEAGFLMDLVTYWNVSVVVNEKATGEPRPDLHTALRILSSRE